MIQYRSWRNGVQTDRYYISNADKSVEEFYRSIRGHWSIENRLHWSLDVVFGEDAAQVSRDHEMRKPEYFTEDGIIVVEDCSRSDERAQKAFSCFHET